MVKWYSECTCCGAITIYLENGTHKAVHKNYVDLTKAVRLRNSYHCENCYPMEKVCEYIMKDNK